ncbi:uncharacterized protein LOC129216723 [Uloborus diversus]|uniref:uncharacterized protein LOC129216723 n=1 Tax=Uloborus diversus TaxID=327109 RepID=UPI00240A2C81|nr:uncharacterized protein LOC129216723 [Uloborus diversus]
MTLMRLRRLSKTILSKKMRWEFEERKLCRSNVVRFLDSHLTSSSVRVRYLTLELMCCTVPRLGSKTDYLLNPVMPKVIRRLGAEEGKEMKLKALHFLRAYFRHTEDLKKFVEDFLYYGIGSDDSTIRITCYLGLSIIFDQDIGDDLYFSILNDVAKELERKMSPILVLTAFRAIKRIHEMVCSDRFFTLLNRIHPESKEVYKTLVEHEECDQFLSLVSPDCTTVVATYQAKRNDLGLRADFGIAEHRYLDRIGMTRECERASAVSGFTLAIKRSYWTDANLECHLLDLLKFISCLLSDQNRLIQMNSYDILKEVINRMSFHLASDLRSIVGMLRKGLISRNIKIQTRADRLLQKLMRNIHPMTVIWELLNTRNPLQKEAALRFIASKLECLPYYELDMVSLCNAIGYMLEDPDAKIQAASVTCMKELWIIMKKCPVFGIKVEAIRILSTNCHLKSETLKLLGLVEENDQEYLDESELYSEDETSESALSRQYESASTSTTLVSEQEVPDTPTTTQGSNVWPRKLSAAGERIESDDNESTQIKETEKEFVTPEMNETDDDAEGRVTLASEIRDLEYASKAGTCSWAEKFEEEIKILQPYQSTEVAEIAMKKALEDLDGKNWKDIEDAMTTLIVLAMHHPELISDSGGKIVVAICAEIKSFRQSVAGKAILTAGHVYARMGKCWESKLKVIIQALLSKSGNRTSAALFRLVIISLFRIANSVSPQKAALALANEGCKHANRTAKETAAQFLFYLTEKMGPEISLTGYIASHMLRAAAIFVLDSSALTRYCGRRMFGVLMKNKEFNKLKDHYLDMNTLQNLAKTLDLIKSKNNNVNHAGSRKPAGLAPYNPEIQRE